MPLMALANVPFTAIIDSTHAILLKQQVISFLQKAQLESAIRRTPIAFCIADQTYQCSDGRGKYLLLWMPTKHFIPAKKPSLMIAKMAAEKGRFYWRTFPRSQPYLQFNFSHL